jgi:hypothetical protein
VTPSSSGAGSSSLSGDRAVCGDLEPALRLTGMNAGMAEASFRTPHGVVLAFRVC